MLSFQGSRWAAVRAGCRACVRILSSRIGVLALIIAVAGFIGADPFRKYVVGQLRPGAAMTEAWEALSAFVDNPLVRVCAVFVGFWLFSRAAKGIILADEARALREAKSREALAKQQRAMLSFPVLLTRHYAHERELREFEKLVEEKTSNLRTRIAEARAYWSSPQVYRDIPKYDLRFEYDLKMRSRHTFLEPTPESLPGFPQLLPHHSHTERAGLTSRNLSYDPVGNEEFLKKFEGRMRTIEEWLRSLEAAVKRERSRLAKAERELTEKLSRYAG
jgi:hypothetical protein